MGTLCAGTCLSWTSPVFDQLMPHHSGNSSSNITQEFIVSPKEGAIIGGILAIGAFISAIPAGYFADKLGRKKVILVLSLSFLLNWILTIFAQNSLTLIMARIFAGIGTGGICVIGPIYIGEIAENSLRGTLGALLNMFLALGILITSVIGSFTTWRVLSMALCTIPIMFFVSFFFMPETPVFLLQKKQNNRAEKSLKFLRGHKYDTQNEMKEIEKEIENSQTKTGGIKDIFSTKGNRRAFLSVVVVAAFQQLCGINAVVFYTVPIFKAAGSNLSPSLAGILIGLVQVSFAYLSILIIDKANRKFYLMLSSTGMLLFSAALGMYFQLKQLNWDISYLNFLPIASAVMFMAFFSIGYGPVPWMLMGELFAPEIKGIGSGIAILCNWLCAFLVTFSFPIITDSIGSHVFFYIMTSLMAVATIFVYFVVPETRGKTLLQIQELLNK